MRDKLEQLRVLLAVAESGSFTGAASERNAEVSAVSRAIHDLEVSIGALLFDRLARGVRLTAAGESYVASAREILERYERAGPKARLASTRHPLHLSLGYPWSAASRPLVELLRSFAANAAIVAVELVELGNDELIERLKSSRLDVALAGADPPGLPRLKNVEPLASAPLWLEQLVAVVPADVGASSVTWRDLLNVRLLCRTIDDWPRFVRHVERLGGPRLKFEPHAISREGVLGLVAAGLGWTVIPASLGHLLPEGVSVVPITSAGAALQVEALWRSGNANPALTRFLALCRQLYGPTPDDAPSRSPDLSP